MVLKLKPSSGQPDLSSLDSEQLNTFVDEMVGDLQDSFTRNINGLRDQIKSARPDPSDPNYVVNMQLYQELLSTMVPVIQKIQALAGQILDELHALINQLWDDICKNNGTQVDSLLEEHARRTEMNIKKTFLKPLDKLEEKLKQIKEGHAN